MATPYDPQYKPIVDKIKFYGNKHGVNPEIGIKQLWQESRFKQYAKSPAGAEGISQFMPGTAADWGVDVYDIDSSIEGWARYMAWILKQPYIGGDYAKALAAYNWGIGNVQRKGITNLPKETKNYLKIILGDKGTQAGLGIGTFVALGFAAYFLSKAYKTF